MDDTSLIAAFQLADSFFPSGMVTFSHGLETFLSLNPRSGTDIARLLDDYLHGKVAPCDLVAYAHAYRAAEAGNSNRLYEIDRLLTASLLPQELRQASARSGRALIETLRAAIDDHLFQQFARVIQTGSSDGNASVCLGILSSVWKIPLRAGALLHLYTFAVSFLGAALRLGDLGHREAQRILTELRPRLSPFVDMALEQDLEELSSFAPLADIRAMQHAYLPVRLFSS
jgi:urease accessory protein